MDAVAPGPVLDAAMRAGARWAELFVEDQRAETVRLDGGRVAELRTDRDVGAAVRVVAGDTVGLAYTNRVSTDALVEIAHAASTAVAAAASTLKAGPPRQPIGPTVEQS